MVFKFNDIIGSDLDDIVSNFVLLFPLAGQTYVRGAFEDPKELECSVIKFVQAYFE